MLSVYIQLIHISSQRKKTSVKVSLESIMKKQNEFVFPSIEEPSTKSDSEYVSFLLTSTGTFYLYTS